MTHTARLMLGFLAVSLMSACAIGGTAEGDGDGGAATNTVTVSPEVGDVNL